MNDAEASEKSLDFRLGPLGAAIPLIFFVIWAVTTSMLQLSSELGLVIGILMGITLGLFFCRSAWQKYAETLFEGMTQPVGVVAIIAWFYAGVFAQVLQVGGLVEGLVWLGGVSGATGGVFVALTFLLAAVFSTAVGTGYGTVVAFCTLMYPAGVMLNADPVILFGAILSGAIFGDNLAPVSDTTIISASTQNADAPGVVRSRLKYAVAAAIPTVILFAIFGGGSGVEGADASAVADIMNSTNPAGLGMLIPFAVVLALAFSGQHLISSLTWGILVAVILIPSIGTGALTDILAFDASEPDVITGALAKGIDGYINMAVLIMLIVTAAHLMRVGGTMNYVTKTLMNWIGNSVRRVEVANWAIVGLLNSAITINTAAEITAAPFVRDLGSRFRLHRYRLANMLDAVTSAMGYIFPWGAPVLLGWSAIQTAQEQYGWLPIVSPTSVFPFVFDGWILLFVMLFAALTGWGRTYEGADGSQMRERPATGA
ncbi:Na+/H+ antiporter NhaC family protein [Salinisphaera sp. USBA-960]|uniref:Na+/H+ antiporter NhaC family protein n=1 Tax=Salinisphaera orenii TaxID=856731 RepID=UPI000DBE9DE5|nr:Na+/H+ antiporter NhaC family protein [Salifodinibacter halophilus]NNC26431.1 Na+/H+ antiporter NhaC family protein [Salifodinibacter halophilus]